MNNLETAKILKKELRKDEIKTLSEDLYLDLPFWKRRNICKWYNSNNWDITLEYRKCVDTARKMVDDRDYWIEVKSKKQGLEKIKSGLINNLKTMKNKYRCNRCGKIFYINHTVDIDGAVCNECFKIIISSKSVEEYNKNNQ